MQRQYIVKIIGNVSDWLSYAGGALIKVADSAFYDHLASNNDWCKIGVTPIIVGCQMVIKG